ncbi:MAG: phosphoenolpyruvate kinase [Elusimicrobiota bacterium]|mgnify:FL=1
MPTKLSVSPKALGKVVARLKKANAATARAYPGDPANRQPVHTVYGGAHLFKSDSALKLGQLALRSLHQFAPESSVLAEVLGLSPGLGHKVYDRVVEKLKREPVEDFRIDFEDGYGNRPDEEEDHHAILAAEEVVRGLHEGSLPPFIGIRIKPFNNELYRRSMRTMDLFITTLLARGGKLPPNFVVTVPKLLNTEQVAAVSRVLALIEAKQRLPAGTLKIELMVETTQSILTPEGSCALRGLVAAAEGRCTGAHFGTYDYTAGCNITAAQQRMDHPACDFAKHMMQVSLTGTGVMLSDGATNVMPVGPHRSGAGSALSSEQIHENVVAVHRAWRLHYDHARHSLESGFYQGWDLHPAQLATRYAAVYAFFLEGLAPASARLKNFIEKAAQATLVGDVFDDAATGQGLLNYFLRGLNCGAITEEEAQVTGLSREELQGRSFLKILEGRRKA